jgi:hypothetical protein
VIQDTVARAVPKQSDIVPVAKPQSQSVPVQDAAKDGSTPAVATKDAEALKPTVADPVKPNTPPISDSTHIVPPVPVVVPVDSTNKK